MYGTDAVRHSSIDGHRVAHCTKKWLMAYIGLSGAAEAASRHHDRGDAQALSALGRPPIASVAIGIAKDRNRNFANDYGYAQ